MKRAMSTSMRVPAIVSTAWLHANLQMVKVVDASWYLPAMKRDGASEFEYKRIPTARFFDVDVIASAYAPDERVLLKVYEQPWDWHR